MLHKTYQHEKSHKSLIYFKAVVGFAPKGRDRTLPRTAIEQRASSEPVECVPGQVLAAVRKHAYVILDANTAERS